MCHALRIDYRKEYMTREGRPIMPWASVRAMDDADKRAIYRYIRSLPGEPGEAVSGPSVTGEKRDVDMVAFLSVGGEVGNQGASASSPMRPAR